MRWRHLLFVRPLPREQAAVFSSPIPIPSALAPSSGVIARKRVALQGTARAVTCVPRTCVKTVLRSRDVSVGGSPGAPTSRQRNTGLGACVADGDVHFCHSEEWVPTWTSKWDRWSPMPPDSGVTIHWVPKGRARPASQRTSPCLPLFWRHCWAFLCGIPCRSTTTGRGVIRVPPARVDVDAVARLGTVP